MKNVDKQKALVRFVGLRFFQLLNPAFYILFISLPSLFLPMAMLTSCRRPTDATSCYIVAVATVFTAVATV